MERKAGPSPPLPRDLSLSSNSGGKAPQPTSSDQGGAGTSAMAEGSSWVDEQRALVAMKERLQQQLFAADKQGAALLLQARLKRRRRPLTSAARAVVVAGPPAAPSPSSSSTTTVSTSTATSTSPPLVTRGSSSTSTTTTVSPSASGLLPPTRPEKDGTKRTGGLLATFPSFSYPPVFSLLRTEAPSADTRQHRRRKYELLSAEEEDVPTDEERDKQSEVQAATISRPATHMSIWSTNKRFLEVFQAYIWASAPLNPAVLDEDNVRSVLYVGDDTPNPLALNVHIALALGALALGEKGHSDEHYMKARRHLEELFDSSDYAVAEALQGMRYYASGQGNVEQTAYYLLLSMNMCRRLNIYHGDVYARTMTLYYFLPTTTIQEKQRIVREFGVNFPHRRNVLRTSAGARRDIDSLTFSSIMLKENRYPNYKEIERMTYLYVQFLMNLDLVRHSGNADDRCLFEFVKGMEVTCVEEVLAVPCLFSKSALLGSLCHQAQVAWGLGEREHAVRCATFWLELAQQLPMQFCSPTMLLFIQAILEVWVGINDERRLRLSLDQIRPLAQIYHPWARVYDAYSAMLPTIQHKSRRIEQPLILPSLIPRVEEEWSPSQPPSDGSVQLHTQASTHYSSLQTSPYISPTASGSPTSTALSSLPYSSPTSDLPPGLRDRSLPRQLASRSNPARDMEELVDNLLDDNITST